MAEFKTALRAALVPVAIATATGCGFADLKDHRGVDANSSARGNEIRLRLHTVMDSQGTGKRAGTYLIPEGWTAQDTIIWFPDNYLTPAVGSSVAKSPDGLMRLDASSAAAVGFSHSPAGDTGQLPPRSVSALLLASWKHQHPGVGYEILVSKDTKLDNSFFAAAGAPVSFAQIGNLKLRFKHDGHTLVSKCSARMDAMSTGEMATAIGGTMYEGSWMLSNVWIATAPESQLPKAMKLLGIILASSRTDIHFYNTVLQCQRIIQQNFYARQHEIMETSRIISQTNDEISDAINSSYASQQAVEDHAIENFDDYIRGIDRYEDEGSEVSLPSNWDHAWSDGNGRYVVCDSSNYDPNVVLKNGTWHEMNRRR